jgi:8-oxo-dGTP pyrophosphatase MutT (NUDIX family)
MNKKIYFNDKFIAINASGTGSPQDLEIRVENKEHQKYLIKIVNEFLSSTKGNSIQIKTDNIDQVFNEIKQLFYYIEAAGGFIENNEKFLFIHRQNKWDLPKGKLEKGEAIKNAAMRECEEECGIKNLTISKQLPSTYHIYPFKKGFALKQTYWFYMLSNYDNELTPQHEEDIDEVKWFNKNEVMFNLQPNTYSTIANVIDEAFKPQ